MKKLFFLFMSASLLLGVAMPLVALAQTAIPTCTTCNLPYTPLEPIPGLTTNNDPSYLTSPGNLPNIISAIFKVFITVGAFFAVFMLAVGGIQYMVSGGPADKQRGIQRAKAALWGIVLIAAAWLILYTINPNLLNFNLNPCPNNVPGITCNVNAPPSATNTSAASANTTDTTYAQSIASALDSTPPTQQACSDMYNAYYNPIALDGLTQGVSMIYVALKDGLASYVNAYASPNTTQATQIAANTTASSFNTLGQSNLNFLQRCQSAGLTPNQ